MLLVGCSVNQDALVSSSSDPEPTINSTSVPNVDQKEQPFLDYPDTVFAYVCHQWKEKEIDNRFNLSEGESAFLRDSLVFNLFPLDNDYARIHITSRIETEYSEWLDGKYQSLGDHIYKFSVKYASPKSYGYDGPESYNDFVTEGEAFSGYFVIEENTLYYLGDSEDFSNYQNYPACEFYYSIKMNSGIPRLPQSINEKEREKMKLCYTSNLVFGEDAESDKTS